LQHINTRAVPGLNTSITLLSCLLLLLLCQFGGVDLDPASATLWFAGKQLLPDKLLSEYMGRNERTRAVVKLQKNGQGPPAREPVSACGG
jgi:hypothetical protein